MNVGESFVVWGPIVALTLIYVLFLIGVRRRSAKQAELMAQVGQANTRAVEANTAAIKELLEELRAGRRQ